MSAKMTPVKAASCCASILAATLVPAGALAAEPPPVTVKSLLTQGFTVVAAIPSNIGAGVFLQKKDKVFLCFVNETPQSASVATKYCKPVE